MAGPWQHHGAPVLVDLRLYLAGRLTLEVAGKVAFDEGGMRGRQTRLAFAYLACHRERPVAREELAEALWPEEMPAAWESGLNALVSRLRTLIAHPLPATAGMGLRRTADGYRLLTPGTVWVDLDSATRSLDEAETAGRAGRLRDAFGPAVVASSIARRPFLAGCSGPWVDGVRDRLERQLLRALDCLARVWVATGEPGLAVEASSEAVAIDPFRESSHLLLMQAHVAAGNPAEALRAYAALRDLLARELGAEPAPELQQLYRRLVR